MVPPVPYYALEVVQARFYTFLIQFGLSSSGAAVMSAGHWVGGALLFFVVVGTSQRLPADVGNRVVPTGLVPPLLIYPALPCRAFTCRPFGAEKG